MGLKDKSLNDRIKKTRTLNELTQKEFAERLNVGVSTIGSIENYTNNPSNQLLYIISQEFGIKEKWLNYGKGEMKKSPEEIIGEAVSKLSKEEAEAVITKYAAAIGNEDKLLDFDKEKDKPKFYKILDFLKKEYEEAEQDMKGYLTIKLQKDFPEYDEYVKKNQSEQKNA
ncbi:MAG: helix-turn-helix transcriptional regulator [Firmicutes bacterium]|nr:helix-turn-helix transcriptional regulator [Bacillota bacterium]